MFMEGFIVRAQQLMLILIIVNNYNNNYYNFIGRIYFSVTFSIS